MILVAVAFLWKCPLEWFNDGMICDCFCDATDPDCVDLALPVHGCSDGETCLEDPTRCIGLL